MHMGMGSTKLGYGQEISLMSGRVLNAFKIRRSQTAATDKEMMATLEMPTLVTLKRASIFRREPL